VLSGRPLPVQTQATRNHDGGVMPTSIAATVMICVHANAFWNELFAMTTAAERRLNARIAARAPHAWRVRAP